MLEDEIRKGCDIYEFYNVLWVKREAHYIVREALGWVENSAWERQAFLEVDMQLQ